jgi:uncharacterized protein (DUF1501 family)
MRKLAASQIDRRVFLKVGASGLFTALAARWLLAQTATAQETKSSLKPAAAKACIVLWLNGGPSHLDTFDPKPGTAVGGPFKAIKTRAPAIMLSEHLPLLAEQADKIAVVRGMTSKEGNHQRAQYLLHTGYSPNPTVVHPALGAWASRRMGDANSDLPGFVSIGGPSGGPGILGPANGPFIVLKAGEIPQNAGPVPGVGADRFARRASGLGMLESRFAARTGDGKVEERRAVYTKATRLMHSPHLLAFDLADEPEALRTSYGDTDFGRGCLTARRLVEAGVKFIEVVLDGWDTHVNNFNRTRDLMKTFDPAIAALLRDLSEKKMLGSTLIACMGDFGRTPHINGNDGRDHYPQAWSALLAGAGVRGGIVHGQTDAEGARVVANAVTVPNLFATLATQLGLDPGTTAMSPIGRPIAVTDDGLPVKELVGG